MPTKKSITLIGHTAKKSEILVQTVFTFYELVTVLIIITIIIAVFARVICALFFLAAEKSGCVKYAVFFVGFILV